MNYSRQNVERKIEYMSSEKQRWRYKFNRYLRYCYGIILFAIAVMFAFKLFDYVNMIEKSAKKIAEKDLLYKGKQSTVYDISGKTTEYISYRDVNQIYVPFKNISKPIREAFIIAVDSKFYEHPGIDVGERLQSFMSLFLVNRDNVKNNDTITKHLIQNRIYNEVDVEEESLTKKLEAEYMSIYLENKMKKDDIFETYLNTVYFGENILGIEAASRYFFGKSAKEINVSEATVLVAVALNPSSMQPVLYQSENSSKRQEILRQLLENKYISENEYEDAIGDDVYNRIEENKKSDFKDNNYSCYTKAMLDQIIEDMKKNLGYTETQAYNILYREGVKIYSCQDSELQATCEEVVGKTKGIKGKEISLMLMEQRNGNIRAILGKESSSQIQNSVTKVKVQPGTLFDILSTYVPSLDTAGMTLGTVLDDNDMLFPDSKAPIPVWNNSKNNGYVTIRKAISAPLSVPAVKLLEKISIQTAYEYLQRFGITTLVEQKKNNLNGNNEKTEEGDLQYKLAVGQLTEGVTNYEMTAAYASIGNKGEYIRPKFYNKVVDSKGNVVIENKAEKHRIMKDTTAWLISNAMSDSQINNIAVSGRIGLTPEKQIDWYEGYTPFYSAGIWIKEKGDKHVSKTIWQNIMAEISNEKSVTKVDFLKPDEIKSCLICNKCGNLAVKGLCDKAEGGNAIEKEYFEKGTEPTINCTCHVKYNICKDSNCLATENCPKENIIQKVLLKKIESNKTKDFKYTVDYNITGKKCDIH